MKNIVEVKNITKSYGNVTAVNDVTFEIKDGEFFSLLGPSGCGKTTILRIIGGFIDTDGGKVLIDNKDMKNVAPNKRDTSMVFQNLALFPHMNVSDNITYGLKKRGLKKDLIVEKLNTVLSVINLTGFENRRITQLSGGQQQRVALARSLIIEPKILLLDEPLASLDKKLRISMRSELKDIQRRTGTTFLYVTHDQSEALTMSDTVAVMNHGKIIQMGKPDHLYDWPTSSFVADFIGAGNFIKTKKIEFNGAQYIITAEKGGKILLDKDNNLNKINSNDLSFFIRPEKIKLSADVRSVTPDTGTHFNHFSGRIIEKIFEGPDIRLSLFSEQIGAVTIELKSDRTYRHFKDGTDISFSWSSSEGTLLTGP